MVLVIELSCQCCVVKPRRGLDDSMRRLPRVRGKTAPLGSGMQRRWHINILGFRSVLIRQLASPPTAGERQRGGKNRSKSEKILLHCAIALDLIHRILVTPDLEVDLPRDRCPYSPRQKRWLRLQTSDFRLQTSDFRLQTSDFRLQTSDFRLQKVRESRLSTTEIES